MRLPKKLYRVVVTQPCTKWRYGAKRGGSMTQLPYVRERVESIRKDGGDAKVYVCEPERRELEL